MHLSRAPSARSDATHIAPWTSSGMALFIGGVAALHVELLGLAAAASFYKVSPDAIAYLRIAEYYREGRLALAINGYWGPMLSWLIAALTPLLPSELMAAHAAIGISAVAFLWSAVRLFRALELARSAIVAGALVVLVFSVCWSALWISPDLMMGALLLLGLGFTLDAGPRGTGTHPLIAGLCYGAAYLAKSAALPIAFGWIVGLGVIRAVTGAADPRVALRDGALGLAGIGALALPWIVILSVHYGTPTISTSAAINHAIAGPEDVDRYHPTFRMFHQPAPGRITSWEDPSGMPYRRWSPFDSTAALVFQARLVARNAVETLRKFADWDYLRLGLLASAAGLLLHAPWRVGFRVQRWRLMGAVLATGSVVFTPVQSEDTRYFLFCYPLLLAAAFGFLSSAIGPVAPEGRRFSRLFAAVTAGIVAVSFLVPLRWFAINTVHGFVDRSFLIAGEVARKMAPEPPGALVSSRDKRVALYTAYLSHRRFFGEEPSVRDSDALRRSGAAFLIIGRDAPMYSDIAGGRVPTLEPFATDPSWPVAVYRIRHDPSDDAP